MHRNNISRAKFKEFLILNNLDRIDARNVFDYDGKRYCFALIDKKDTIRQFYADCDGVFFSGCFIDRRHLHISGCTRKTPRGTRANNAKIDYTKVRKSGLKYPS